MEAPVPPAWLMSVVQWFIEEPSLDDENFSIDVSSLPLFPGPEMRAYPARGCSEAAHGLTLCHFLQWEWTDPAAGEPSLGTGPSRQAAPSTRF